MSDTLGPLRSRPGVIRLYGHRGCRGLMPENTLESFRHTLSLGIRAIEIDVLATRDGVPVVTHNPRLLADSTRDPDGRWLEGEGPRIHELTYQELQGYDVGALRPGSAYADLFPEQAVMPGLRVPAFAAVAALAAEPANADVWLNVEIKSDPGDPANTPPIPEFVRGVLTPIWRARIADRVLLQSFDWRILAEIRRQAPGLPLSYLTYLDQPRRPPTPNIWAGSPWMAGHALADHGGSLPRTIAAAGGQAWAPHYSDINRPLLEEARALGLLVNVWTANAPADIDRMIALGVDGIITDYPGRAQRRLMAFGLDWRG